MGLRTYTNKLTWLFKRKQNMIKWLLIWGAFVPAIYCWGCTADLFCNGNAACGFQVNSDGLISFGAAMSNQHTARPLPISSPSTPFIAVYWADVDTTKNNGRIYYRSLTTAGKCVLSHLNTTALYPEGGSQKATLAVVVVGVVVVVAVVVVISSLKTP